MRKSNLKTKLKGVNELNNFCKDEYQVNSFIK